jgi:alpha-L-rhamnosidase
VLSNAVKKARIYVCGLGFHELVINGVRVGDHVLDPAYTRYDVRALFVTHDVTRHLQLGENAVGILLGNGMYNYSSVDIWDNQTALWRDRPKVRFQLEVELDDGGRFTLVSDRQWKTRPGPLVVDEVRGGETYDARLEQPGWDQPAFDDCDWTSAHVVPGPGGRLVAQTVPVRIQETIAPTSISEVSPGVYVADFGRNLTGWTGIEVTGAEGSEVVLAHAELLSADGTIDQSNINTYISGDCQTDRYVLRGGSPEKWEPRFTYHGFRYVQIAGLQHPPSDKTIWARVVHTDMEPAGHFSSSSDTLNKIQAATVQSYRSNFVGAPLDCPHREKNSWLGDQVAETGLYNFDVAPAYVKWIDDIADVQRPSGQLPAIAPTAGWGYNNGSGPAWDSTYIFLPWHIFQMTGDRDILARHFDGMVRYLRFLDTMHEDHILRFGLGDWCPPGGFEGWFCPLEITSTATWFRAVSLLAAISRELGNTEETERFEHLAGVIRSAFNAAFYDAEIGQYLGGEMTAQACALFYGLVDDDQRKRVLEGLIAKISEANDHVGVGMLGARYLMNTLADAGHADLAYRIAVQPTYPGWGHWIAQGATTLWETWDGSGSRNHIMFGDISAWMFKTLAGISPDEEQPGFQRVHIAPSFVTDLDWVDCEHVSPFGAIRINWWREGVNTIVELRIPANTTARLSIPASPGDHVKCDDPGVPDEVASDIGHVVLELGSGEYTISVIGAQGSGIG